MSTKYQKVYSIVALAMLGGQGYAQSTNEAGSGLEEVIVTAERRSESLQQTPVSIIAFSAADL